MAAPRGSWAFPVAVAYPLPSHSTGSNPFLCSPTLPSFTIVAKQILMILQKGEKVHVIHRRLFEKEARRHFVGIVEDYEGGVARVVGYVYTVDRSKFTFVRRPEKRTRIISLVSGNSFVNVLPDSVVIEKIVYKQEKKAVRVTDGSSWYLDLSEVAWL